MSAPTHQACTTCLRVLPVDDFAFSKARNRPFRRCRYCRSHPTDADPWRKRRCATCHVLTLAPPLQVICATCGGMLHEQQIREPAAAIDVPTTDDLTVLAVCWADCVEAGPAAIRRAVTRLEELLLRERDSWTRQNLTAGIAELRETGSASMLSGALRVWEKTMAQASA